MSDHRIEDMAAGQVDLLDLGDALFRIPLIGLQFRHKEMSRTITYLHPSTPTTNFLCDVVWGLTTRDEHGMTLDAFAEKWYGGRRGGLQLLNNYMKNVTGPPTNPPTEPLIAHG